MRKDVEEADLVQLAGGEKVVVVLEDPPAGGAS
jgi:hypothetical protein